MYIIKKVINNNAVLVTDSRLQEYVIMGSGIAFKKKVDDIIDKGSNIEKKFLLTKDSDKENIVDLIRTTDSTVINTLDEIVTMVSQNIAIDYNGYQYYSLLDHLIGTLNRIEKNIDIKSNFTSEDIMLYELELVVADKIARIIKSNLNITLTTEEIYIFAIHLNNAQNEISFSNLSQDIVIILKEILKIVQSSIEINKNDFFYNRFLLHLKFFALRHLNKTNEDNADSMLFDTLAKQYSLEKEIVEKICIHLDSKYSWKIFGDERLYLLLHLAKLNK